MSAPVTPRLGRTFLLLWLSESVFDLGANLMGFALGVWIFEETGSAEQFAWSVLCSTLPALLLMPFAGALADRFDRRRVILTCDLMAALLVAVLALTFAQGRLEIVHLYLFNAATAAVGALRNPAYKATVSQVVPKDRLTQANGAMNLSEAVLQVGAPLMAGYLMAATGLAGVMVAQVALVLAGAAAVFSALTNVRRLRSGNDAGSGPLAIASAAAPHARLAALWQASRDSLSSATAYFRAEPLMIGLLLYVVLQESLLVFVTAMITPLVLSTHSSETLGWILTVGGVGGVAGSLLLVVHQIERHLMRWVLAADLVLSLAVAVAGVSTSPWVWGACAFIAMGAGSASGVCAGALWMRKAPTATQGSVFALVDALHLAAACVVVLLGGMAGERLFEPALQPGGAWSGHLGAWMGVGPGRGYGLLFALCGCVCVLVSLLALAHRSLRQLDARVPDREDLSPTAAPASVLIAP